MCTTVGRNEAQEMTPAPVFLKVCDCRILRFLHVLAIVIGPPVLSGLNQASLLAVCYDLRPEFLQEYRRCSVEIA